MFTELSNVLVLNFSGMENTVFFNEKVDVRWYFSWHGILCLLITGNSLIGTFQRWKILSFFNQKIDEKIIFILYFWAFHDVPGLGKYGFLYKISIPDIT